MKSTTERLIIEHVTKTYKTDDQQLEVLRGVDLTVGPGETVAIIGPSGSGKSTLLNIAGSLDKPTSGKVRLGDTIVSELAGNELAHFRALRVGFVFQDHHLLPQLTALENILLPTIPGRTQAGSKERALALIERIGLDRCKYAFPHEMSGGERQRVAIARALINEPGLLLCDEPTGNLDMDSGANIILLLLDMARDSKVSVVMVTHNVGHAERLDRRMRLSSGKLVPFDIEPSVLK